MTRSLLAIALLAFVLSSCGQSHALSLLGTQPRDLTDCFHSLDSTIGPDKIAQIKAMSENEFVTKKNFGLPAWMQKHWWFWAEGDLNRTFQALGVTQLEDMSAIILTSYHRYLMRSPLEIQKTVDSIKADRRSLNLRWLLDIES
jgi:hypothetical protein